MGGVGYLFADGGVVVDIFWLEVGGGRWWLLQRINEIAANLYIFHISLFVSHFFLFIVKISHIDILFTIFSKVQI